MNDLGPDRVPMQHGTNRIGYDVNKRTATRAASRATGRAMTVTTLVASLALGACSSVPDALNPAEWYRSTVDLFTGDDKSEAASASDPAKQNELTKARGTAPPGSDQQYPTLGSVERKRQQQARDNLKGGLVADPQRPQYAPAIARQGEPSTMLASRPPAPPAASVTAAVPSQPAPPAQPAAPVTAVPVAPATQVAAAAPPPPNPAVADEPLDQQALAERLQARLAEIRARSNVQGSLMVANAPLLTAGDSSTVIVSSGGIETGSVALSSPGPVAVAPLGALTSAGIDNRGALPIPAGSVRIATIQFGNGSASLQARERQILASVSKLQRERGGKVRVVGHASSRTRAMDPVRHKMVNFQVSIQRADTVAKALVGLGVKADDVLIAAVGDEQPMYFEVMLPTGEAGNRRTEIYLGN